MLLRRKALLQRKRREKIFVRRSPGLQPEGTAREKSKKSDLRRVLTVQNRAEVGCAAIFRSQNPPRLRFVLFFSIAKPLPSQPRAVSTMQNRAPAERGAIFHAQNRPDPAFFAVLRGQSGWPVVDRLWFCFLFQGEFMAIRGEQTRYVINQVLPFLLLYCSIVSRNLQSKNSSLVKSPLASNFFFSKR